MGWETSRKPEDGSGYPDRNRKPKGGERWPVWPKPR